MVEESVLKQEGEDLARIAVQCGMGHKQLRAVYRLVRLKPIPFIEVYLKRQMARDIPCVASFNKLLELLFKYTSVADYEKILMYATMLYPYYEKEPILKLRIPAEPVIREIVQRNGFKYSNLAINIKDDKANFNVRVDGFRGNPRLLAQEIEKELKARMESLLKSLKIFDVKVWIEGR